MLSEATYYLVWVGKLLCKVGRWSKTAFFVHGQGKNVHVEVGR